MDAVVEVERIEFKMKTMTLFVEKSNVGTNPPALPFVASEPEADGTILGRFVDVSKTTLIQFLQPSLDGKLYTFMPGKRYKVTQLMAEGSFVLVPEFK
jgi:hypothetical protein